MHDAPAAELALKTTKADANDPTINAIAHFVRGMLAGEAHDTARAASEMEAFQQSYTNPVVSTNYPGYDCWMAPAEEAAGHPNKADAVIAAAQGPTWTAIDSAATPGWAGRLAGRAEGLRRCRCTRPRSARGLLLLGCRARPSRRSGWCRQPSSRRPTSAGHTGPIRSRPGAIRWSNRASTREALDKYDEALKYAPNWTAA